MISTGVPYGWGFCEGLRGGLVGAPWGLQRDRLGNMGLRDPFCGVPKQGLYHDILSRKLPSRTYLKPKLSTLHPNYPVEIVKGVG